jgi:hypothetical protein
MPVRRFFTMNIFVLDRNPEKAAADHCDKHVVKMVLESGQLLATAHHLSKPRKALPPIKATHANHPCAIWVRSSLANYRWLARLATALAREYTRRYGRIHSWQEHIEWLAAHEPRLPDIGLTPFAQAMPEHYRNKNAVRAYRAYYRGEKVSFARWKTRPPRWWNN